MQEVKDELAKAKITVPVTIADYADTWAANPSMVEAVDIVSANQYPYWEKKNANESAAWFYKRMEPVIASAIKYKKKILISETGWATGGFAAKAGPSTPAQAAKYLNDFSLLAKQMDWNYYYFTSFDMAFNSNETDTDNVEQHFGLFYANGTMKPCYANLTVTGTSTVVTKAPSQLATVTPAPKASSANKTDNATATIKPTTTTVPGATPKSAAMGAALTSLVSMAVASVVMLAL
ncbi:hypothetical protein SDRG_14034 [Saprolegnia diclina VS20]|uniref:glucan endo-1,3-beta-D-glucosidase n=1 Tax=Saprolegnia diclina (strain VS20) TaxID=1156394 RepID=T0Q449_SAPDV|nr:hypothetical protein SDRG_14034 [Saprolegnia diclina VS20]EQC28210.1 hypothetical protein SDRG_14034 [Saprolegnia diclina VS20]|eukprot:XP_008618359.1 hypothetical protein SDRG_14034 [Saprolegnia diclina VS20]